MPRDEDDDTPIRRRTRRRSSVWLHPATLTMAGVLGATVLILFAVFFTKSVQQSEGRRLIASSRWWTSGATPAKVQAIVNELCSYGGLTIYFNSDADFTRSTAYKPTRNGLMHSSEFERMKLAVELMPEEFTNPRVITSGERLQLHVVQSPPGQRLSSAQAVMLIEDELQRSPVNGSGGVR
jgi:hypothetical protein